MVRKIEDRAIKHKQMINPSDYIQKDKLIEMLRAGEIPEEELHDFFSYWNKST